MNIIIIGAGEVGYHIAETLAMEEHNVVIIDKDPYRVIEINRKLDVLTVVGYGSEAATLLKAGVKTCDVLIAATDKDESNIIACFIAKKFNVPFKIARIRHHFFGDKLDDGEDGILFTKEELGIDVLINPEHVTTERILKLITSPAAFEIVEFDEEDVMIKGYHITSGLQISDMSIKEIGEIEALKRMLILAIIRNDELIVPQGEGNVIAGDKVYIIAKKEDFPIIAPYFHESYKEIHKVFIIGVSKITHLLCEEFERQGKSIKVIEEDRAKCISFSEQFHKIEVVNCSYTDREALVEEGLGNIDSFLAVSDDEEKNILASMIAKQERVPKTIASIQRKDYLPLVSLAGVDAIVIPKIATVGEILKYIRRGNVLSIVMLGENNAEIIEYIVREDNKLIGIPLKEIRFPKGCLIAAIIRGEEKIIPKGEDLIKADDKIIIFSSSETVQVVGEFFG